jgi:uncharacterized protein with von Willebrand factor type A (vWA) domain
MQNTTELIAKLLANENLRVEQAAVSTAFFNLKGRVLVLPQWKNMTPAIEEMLVGHEVGHALYTTEDYIHAIDRKIPIKDRRLNFRGAHGYMNVLEDVRIERLMKLRYPGLRKAFMQGYKELNDRDFFGVTGRNLNTLLLIDRINLYFKAGFACGVKFTPEEKVFIDQAQRTETIEDVIELAAAIYEFSATQAKEEQQQQQNNQDTKETDDTNDDISFGDDEEDLDENQDFSDIDDDYSEDEEDLGENQDFSDVDDNYDEDNNFDSASDEFDLESETESTFTKKIEELADISTVYNYYMIEKFDYNPIIDYKTILNNVTTPENIMKTINIHSDIEFKLDRFLSENNSTVNFLAKEFEMRKAATAYRRTSQAKTGQLDMRKLYAYKMKDDLFKRITITKTEKNHGMVLLLDWSGSMNEHLEQTIEQMINLVLFCRKVQIPFQVLAFTDKLPVNEVQDLLVQQDKKQIHKNDKNKLDATKSNMHLLELYNHKMSLSETNQMHTALMKNYVMTKYSLNSTPLNQAMAYLREYLPKFKAKNNVEKITVVTLTDGDSNDVHYTDFKTKSYSIEKVIQHKHFIVSEHTKKNYQFNTVKSCSLTNCLAQIITDEQGVTMIGFHVTGTSMYNMRDSIQSHIELNPVAVQRVADHLRPSMRKESFAALVTPGFSKFFLIAKKKEVENQNFSSLDGNASASSLAKQMTKIMNTNKTSRVLLNNMIDFIA